MASETLQDGLAKELRDLLHAERQLVKALPKMAKAAESEELQQAFRSHLAETEKQARRLESALEQLGDSRRPKPCEGMRGIVSEGEEIISDHDEGPLRDAMMIGAAQKVEHYEIAAYGTAIAWAEELGLSRVAALLEESLKEEKAADEKLTSIAESLNMMAEAPQ